MTATVHTGDALAPRVPVSVRAIAARRSAANRAPPIVVPMVFYNGTPCIPWPGCNSGNGYGVVAIDGKSVRVHRAIYENHEGAIPDGLVIDHLCRNRKCVNPEHMEAVTAGVNALRAASCVTVNAMKTHCKRGHHLSGDNLVIREKGRECRACKKMTNARRYRK